MQQLIWARRMNEDTKITRNKFLAFGTATVNALSDEILDVAIHIRPIEAKFGQLSGSADALVSNTTMDDDQDSNTQVVLIRDEKAFGVGAGPGQGIQRSAIRVR